MCVCTLGCETWVITPRVPSLPRKSSVRLYPADVFLSQTTTSALKMKFCSAESAPWSCSMACSLYNLAVRKHHFKIHTVFFHCSISGCERLLFFAPSDYLWCLTALVPLAPVAHIPHIDASRKRISNLVLGPPSWWIPAPGSTGNQRPEPRRAALSLSLVTPGWTAAVKSSGQRPTTSVIPVTTRIRGYQGCRWRMMRSLTMATPP